MLLQFKNSRDEISEELEERIERQLTRLSRYTGKNDAAAQAFFEIEREVGSKQTGDVWRASVNVDAEGNRYHASELADSPTKASDLVLKELRREMRRAKSKERTLVRKGNAMWKSFSRRIRWPKR